MKQEFLTVSPEVESALASGGPVVALESTVIAHGLPRPQNLETALRLEEIVRANGATPATIAVIEGKPCVGLSGTQIERLAGGDDIRKLSTKDLAIAVAHGWNGATTVASTMFLARGAGVKVFATGGIGGVHRGLLPDVSADLPELAQTPMIVVCSGAKIVLDLPATREWLETYCVPVVGFDCDEMPAFYSRQSGLPVDVRCNTPAEVAQIFNTHCEVGLRSAVLVTVPVPAANEVADVLLQRVLDESLFEAEQNHITGRDLTPFLLSRMSERSAGATLRANIALLENNAQVAGRIACALSQTSPTK